MLHSFLALWAPKMGRPNSLQCVLRSAFATETRAMPWLQHVCLGQAGTTFARVGRYIARLRNAVPIGAGSISTDPHAMIQRASIFWCTRVKGLSEDEDEDVVAAVRS
jgi:hypothetical protein